MFAIVFPGQGSQSVGMLSALAEHAPVVRETLEQASDALGYDLGALIENGPKEQLDQTEYTQPALLAASVAVSRVWHQQNGPQAALCAGHSLGEYSALVHAGALDFGAAVALVQERGRAMQQAVPAGQGAMAALLGMEDAAVEALCAEVANGEVLSAANFNTPGQVVIAGQKSAVERAVAAAKPAGAKKAMLLAVSVPSHCALMQPAADRLAERLTDVALQAPTPSVYHNTIAAPLKVPAQIAAALRDQLHQPVRWTATIQAFAAQGITQVLEFGPGKVLAGMMKRIDKSIAALPVYDPESLDKALEAVTAN